VAVPDTDVVDVDAAPIVVVVDAPDEEVDVDAFDAVPDATVVVLEAVVDGVRACVRKLSTATTPTAVALST
jgi:hypothetical protein